MTSTTTPSGSRDAEGVRRASTVAVLGFVLAVVALGWLVRMEFRGSALRDHIRALEAVTPGMTREEVIVRMGPPSRTVKDDPDLGVHGEALKYGSWRRTQTDIWIILDERGRVKTTFYSDYHFPPEGGIGVSE